MTRLASILGVATVATLVLLSGCESAVKTDYAKDVEGTWNVTVMRDLPIPGAPTMTIPGTSAVAATISANWHERGNRSIEITNTPTATTAAASTIWRVTGDIEVTATEITVSGIVVDPMAVLADVPGGAELLAQDQTLTYGRSI